MKQRRRMVEVSKTKHCNLSRAELDSQLARALGAGGEDSKVVVRRRGACATIRTFEAREAPSSFSAPAPLLPVKDE